MPEKCSTFDLKFICGVRL